MKAATYTPTHEDIKLEAQLTALYLHIQATDSTIYARQLWRDYAQLKSQRSPEMVAHLERMKGLR